MRSVVFAITIKNEIATVVKPVTTAIASLRVYFLSLYKSSVIITPTAVEPMKAATAITAVLPGVFQIALIIGLKKFPIKSIKP